MAENEPQFTPEETRKKEVIFSDLQKLEIIKRYVPDAKKRTFLTKEETDQILAAEARRLTQRQMELETAFNADEESKAA